MCSSMLLLRRPAAASATCAVVAARCRPGRSAGAQPPYEMHSLIAHGQHNPAGRMQGGLGRIMVPQRMR